MSAPVLDLDLSTATVPADFREVEAACTSPENGIPCLQLDRVAIRPGPRRADSASAENILTLCVELLARFSTPNPPKPLTVAMTAAAGGGDAAEVEKRQKRALLLTLVEYLWQCPAHGGLRIAGGLLVLPSGSAQAAADPAAPVAGPSASPATPDDGGATGEEPVTNDFPRKRGADELSDASGIMAETRSLAESLGQGSGRAPSEEQPLTYVSSKDKVSLTFLPSVFLSAAAHRSPIPFQLGYFR